MMTMTLRPKVKKGQGLFLLDFWRRCWSDKNGFFVKLEEWSPEMSWNGFVGFIDSVGSLAASSDQLKQVETDGSGDLWVKIGDFLIF